MAFRWLDDAIDFEEAIGLEDVHVVKDSSGNVDDLSCLLGVENGISANDFMDSLPDELGIPMLDSDDMLLNQDLLKTTSSLQLTSDSLRDLSDSSDSGLDCGSVLVKDEPLSPASSNCSDSPVDCTTLPLIDVQQLPSFGDVLPLDIKLESPPLTPERDQQMDVIELTDDGSVTQPSNRVKIDLSNFNAKTLQTTKLPPGSRILTGANGVRIIQSPVSNNLSKVLNSKVKIQPKPPAAIQPQPSVQGAGPGKPLVLTAEEFAKLTQQGLLKFQHPDDQKPNVISQTASVLAAPPPAVSGTTRHGNNDFKLAKRQQRMIKNRESACLSRKRKKEYVYNVEKQLVEYSDENARLKEQNDQLRKRVRMLQAENELLKSTGSSGQVKRATMVMAVLFLVSLNLSSLSGILSGGSTTKQLIEPNRNYHHGRTLLSFNDNTSAEENKSADGTIPAKPAWPATSIHSISAALESLRKARTAGAVPRDLVMVKHLEEINIPVSMCPSYFNSSESERLMNELNGWVLGHKAGMKAAANNVKPNKNNLDKTTDKPKAPTHRQLRKKYAAPRKLKAALKAGTPQYDKDRSQYEVQVFTGPDRDYQDFLQAIHRRNDTFYVVSFRRDHLLLPATAHNQTMRPRMSLLMPAVSTNETMDLPAGNIAMMQIDCEVMATKLLHVHKSTVPTDGTQSNPSNHTATPSVDRNERRKWQQNSKWRSAP